MKNILLVGCSLCLIGCASTKTSVNLNQDSLSSVLSEYVVATDKQTKVYSDLKTGKPYIEIKLLSESDVTQLEMKYITPEWDLISSVEKYSLSDFPVPLEVVEVYTNDFKDMRRIVNRDITIDGINIKYSQYSTIDGGKTFQPDVFKFVGKLRYQEQKIDGEDILTIETDVVSVESKERHAMGVKDMRIRHSSTYKKGFGLFSWTDQIWDNEPTGFVFSSYK